MEPILNDKDIILVNQLGVFWSNVQRDRIIIAKNPRNPTASIFRRIIGVEGDIIHSGYESISVPKGHVWIEGDKKDSSEDSRKYGPIPIALITGFAICKVMKNKLKNITVIVNAENV